MKFCQECGTQLEFCDLAKGHSLSIWLHGCPKCDALWEARGCSVTGRISGYQKSFLKFSEWKKGQGKK
ncbi:MAG: hypothetical protein Q8L57_00770 [bacterium]|nr:hypothetical protein [bacterium]